VHGEGNSSVSADEVASFVFYGAGLTIEAAAPSLLQFLRKDFEYFARPELSTGVRLRAHLAPPPWARVPERVASLVTPGAVSYDDGPVRYNDYHGQALAIYDFASERGELWSEDFDLLYEITYLTALSRIGEIHDRMGIHRVHALGIAVGGRGALVLLPEGGGKTRLALECLRHPGVGLLSDDTPLVRRGRLLAFPTRMGVRGEAEGVAPEHLRRMHRRSHGSKTLIDLGHFASRVIDEAAPAAVVVGRRSSGRGSQIEPVSAARAAPTLAANLVFGLGLPQIVEYFLRGGAVELARKAAIVRSRVGASLGLLRRADCYRLVLGSDVAEGANVVLSVVSR
jgi:hypothetical protein